MTLNVINPAEIECYVQNLKINQILNIGTLNWFENHHQLEKLRQQCLFEALNCVEERVKNVMCSYEKVPLLVYEAICIKTWREKVFKKIVKVVDRQCDHSFIGYMILYHESTAVNFLQILLHHRDTIQALTNEALDLIDYCASEIIYLCSMEKEMYQQDSGHEKNEIIRLHKSEREIRINCGLSSIAIVASFGEYLDDVSVSCVDRMFNSHDFPILMAHLLEVQPWKRVNNKGSMETYVDGHWRKCDTEAVCKSEAQCWFALRGLLLHDAAKQCYEMNDYRKQKLLQVQKFLHEHIIDQISPLMELKQYLSQLSVWHSASKAKQPLLIEVVPEIATSLLGCRSQWKKLAERNISLLFGGNKEEAMAIAKTLSDTYDGDILAEMSGEPGTGNKCQACGKRAEKKCSQCHSAWYCSRECQVKSWSSHKGNCK